MKKIETDEIIEQLIEEQKNDDTETAHGNADNILCDLLIELGYKDVVDAYRKIEKWYAY